MHLPRYHYKTNPGFLDFEFISEGPKGNIKKIIRFTLIGNSVFNLAFGDLDELSGEISDIKVTNNDDSRKVLATVAYTIYDFTNHHPASLVIARGSTLSRTRLYRMGITNHWKEISHDFEVYGLKEGNWEIFIAGSDYESFLIRRK
jgi:hypothetical protein